MRVAGCFAMVVLRKVIQGPTVYRALMVSVEVGPGYGQTELFELGFELGALAVPLETLLATAQDAQRSAFAIAPS